MLSFFGAENDAYIIGRDSFYFTRKQMAANDYRVLNYVTDAEPAAYYNAEQGILNTIFQFVYKFPTAAFYVRF